MKKPPIIIIGAGRSGTNMLRDVLVQLPGLKTWPCDEVNYIWRHGNRDFATDEFTREMATNKVKQFIRSAFDWVERAFQADVVVEKTCANSLRCGFVHEILPEAKFIHLIRDGRDVCISAGERWQAALDIPYLARKARFVPTSDLLYYASRYIGNRIYRIASGKKRLAVWGPKFSGIEAAFREHTLAEACAIQWQYCVGSAVRQLSEFPQNQVHTLRYEDLTAKPVEQLAEVLNFLDIEFSRDNLAGLTKGINNKSVGRWKSKIPSDQVQSIHNLIGAELRQHGYC